jgi:hypothetical protein
MAVSDQVDPSPQAREVELLRAHAERIRASGVLGRSRLTEKLFDYLVECSITGRAPKEIEVAVDVFGKNAEFDVSQDAMVRVYIHKLRRKLDEFYAAAGQRSAENISIPKGAYRFTLESTPAAPVADAPALEHRGPQPKMRWASVTVALALVLSGMIGALLYAILDKPRDAVHQVRANPVWSALLSDDRPIVIVVGDYYIFGELDGGSMDVKRLVREFSINSQSDLQRHLKLHPELEERYMDLELGYLPTASAFALSDVMPVLADTGRRTRVMLMSDLSPATLKSAHVIYVGYLSGLGMLQDLIFSGSRFSVGESYDEIVDRKTNERYVSQVGSPIRGENRYHDYGYFSTFAGPTGNQIVIIAGTRDVAVMQTAEAVTTPARLAELTKQVERATGFEALYEVYGMDRMNLDGKLLFSAPLNTANIWSDTPYQAATSDLQPQH